MSRLNEHEEEWAKQMLRRFESHSARWARGPDSFRECALECAELAECVVLGDDEGPHPHHRHQVRLRWLLDHIWPALREAAANRHFCPAPHDQFATVRAEHPKTRRPTAWTVLDLGKGNAATRYLFVGQEATPLEEPVLGGFACQALRAAGRLFRDSEERRLAALATATSMDALEALARSCEADGLGEDPRVQLALSLARTDRARRGEKETGTQEPRFLPSEHVDYALEAARLEERLLELDDLPVDRAAAECREILGDWIDLARRWSERGGEEPAGAEDGR